MDKALDTLFHPFETGLLMPPADDVRAVFLGARPHSTLRLFPNITLQQYFKPYARILQDQGFAVSSDFTSADNHHNYALVLLPKNMVEARYLLAQGLKILKSGGVLVAAADNNAGGNRIKKILQEFGVENICEESKNKCRVVWGQKSQAQIQSVEKAIEEGQMQFVSATGFQSMPGIFGWDKIDKGSEILLRHVPTDLKGNGADFGCGYGFLARHVLQNCSGVQSLSCIDADYRAIKACRENLSSFKSARFFWEDLTAPIHELSDLDFIIMNPPFHEGKDPDSNIGKSFIQTAAQSLRPAGQLWMVANVQLPYEAVLKENFESVDKKFEGQGFKIYCAVK